MDFVLYEAADFASDESYQRYYFRLDEADAAFWENWIRNHPEKMEAVIQADQLLHFMALRLPEEEQAIEFKRLESAMDEMENENEDARQTGFPTKKYRRLPSRSWLAAAAVVFLIIGSGVVGWWLHSRDNNSQRLASIHPLRTKYNSSDSAMRLVLPDSSVVTLQPAGTISYPSPFAADQRVVNLEGEAFFEVTKNPAKPFFVVHDKLVTKVLGTSFNVKTYKASGQVEVTVRTGRVEVYERADDIISHKKAGSGVVLLPNHKVRYEEKNGRFDRMLVDKPMPVVPDAEKIKPSTAANSFDFKEASLKDIVGRLEKTYGIDISFENPNIAGCHFTGDISRMNLFEQLDILCKSVNAFYEVNGIAISVKGKGCQ